MNNYCVIGYPVAHSRSPELFAEYEINYTRNEIRTRQELADFVADMRKGLFDGCNVTMPWKSEMAGLVDELSETAEMTGAVNTVVNRGGLLYGDSTDGYGMCEALEKALRQEKEPVGEGTRESSVLAGKSVVLLGSGGAARSIAAELAVRGTSLITVVCRKYPDALLQKAEALTNTDKMLALAKKAGEKTKFTFCGFEEAESVEKAVLEADILINCTPVGMAGAARKEAAGEITGATEAELPYNGRLNEKLLVADCVYNPLYTAFLQKAEGFGCRTVDGYQMLKEQARRGACVFGLGV